MARIPAPTRAELQQLAESRLAEAKVLFANALFDGAVYLAGYALELGLKARVCERLDTEYPTEGPYTTFRTHSYETLLKLAGLEKALDAEKLRDTDFASNWSYLTSQPSTAAIGGWSESWRYRRIGSATQPDVARFLLALEDPNSGVLTWLRRLW